MKSDSSSEVTQLLQRWSGGDERALEKLLPLVYSELRRIAQRHLRNERASHTLQSTALVHEAYLKLIQQHSADWQNRSHFFGVAAQLMRRILVDHARAAKAGKRGSGACRVELDENMAIGTPPDVDVIALDDALNKLEILDTQQSRIVELRFFAGLSVDEIASMMKISSATVKRDWVTAKAYLYREISRRPAVDA